MIDLKNFIKRKSLLTVCSMVVLVLLLMMSAGCDVDNGVTPAPDEDEEPELEEKDQYLYQMTDLTYEIDETLGDLTKLEELMDAGEDWALMAEEEIENMENHIQEVKDKSAPEGMEEIHETFLKGVEEMEEGLEIYSQGAEDLDGEKLREGLGIIKKGYEDVDRANVMLYEYD